MRNIWKDGVMGVVVGDALGCPVQFRSREEIARDPVTGMRGYGTFNLPEGSWTDDSSLTLALLESIRRTGGIDLKDIMDNFVRWLDDGEFTPYGYAYDIGRGTQQAIRKYKYSHNPRTSGGHGEKDNGNGSLMRILPAALYCLEKNLLPREAVEIVHAVGGLTHAHIRSNIGCGLYYFMAAAVVDGEGSLAERLQSGLDAGFAFYEANFYDLDDLEFYDRLRDLDAFARLPEGKIRGSGYVVEALEAAVWCLAATHSLEDALLKAVNLGEDTDTVAAIAGGLAGLYYGYQAIPADWLAAIKRREWIEGLCEGIALQ